MARLPYPKSQLDANQVLQFAFNEETGKLRTEAEITASIGEVQIESSAADGDNIAISDGINTLAINPDGSINTNISSVDVELDQATDSVAIGDGTTLVTVTPNKGLNVTVPDSVTGTTNLTALNSAVSLDISGLNSVGFQINSGSLIGTVIAESSVDGGANWALVPFYDPANATTLTNLTFTTANNTRILSIIPLGGSSNVRVRVSNYVSGSATALLRASTVTGAAGAITIAAFGVVSNSFVNITANTPTLLLASNPNRKYAYISNGSATVLKMQMSSPTGLTTSTGLPIPANDYYEFRGDNLFTGDIYVICSNDITIAVTEGSP